MSALIMTIDSDSDKEPGGAAPKQKPPKKGQKSKKGQAPPHVPISPEEEDIAVNKDFNIEDIQGL